MILGVESTAYTRETLSLEVASLVGGRSADAL